MARSRVQKQTNLYTMNCSFTQPCCCTQIQSVCSYAEVSSRCAADYDLPTQTSNNNPSGCLLLQYKTENHMPMTLMIMRNASLDVLRRNNIMQKVLLICSGGEGATAREVLRHKSVEEVVMVDIDKVPCFPVSPYAIPPVVCLFRAIEDCSCSCPGHHNGCACCVPICNLRDSLLVVGLSCHSCNCNCCA